MVALSLHGLVHPSILQADPDLMADDAQHVSSPRPVDSRARGGHHEGADHLVTTDQREDQQALGLLELQVTEDGRLRIRVHSVGRNVVTVLDRDRYEALPVVEGQPVELRFDGLPGLVPPTSREWP